MQSSGAIRKLAILTFLLIYGLLMGGLILAGALGLVTWPAILLAFELTLAIFLLGLAEGMLWKCFLGRKKSIVSNLLGLILIVAIFFGIVTLLSAFYDEPQVGNLRKAFGVTASMFCLGAATEIGRNITSRVQRLRR